MTAQFCLRGHDTQVVGRNPRGMCRTCIRAWDRARNARRRQDPCYVEAEDHYYASWYVFRGYSLRLGARILRGEEKLSRLEAEARTLFADQPGILSILTRPLDIPSAPPWNGDPHSLHAPRYKYRSRPGRYPRVTKDAVEAINAKRPLLRKLYGPRSAA